MKVIVSLVSSIAIVVAMASPSQALEVKKTTRRVVEAMCGGGIQSGGGHSGCTICTSKMCTDYDCTKTSCKLVNIIKGKPGSIRTGGVTTVKGGSGEGNSKSIRRPVNVGIANPPTRVKTPIAVGRGGGMDQSGRRH